MVDCCGVLSTHAGPILITPEVSVFTARYWNLIPELGPHPGEGLGLGHGQCNLNTLNKNLKLIVQLCSQLNWGFTLVS